MGRKSIRTAIVYDFDGTLSPINMQEHDFIPKLGLSHEQFWKEVKHLAKSQNVCEILSYMHLMLREAAHKDIPVQREAIKKYGEDIELFPGVKDWFDLISNDGKELGAKVEHYVVSSGVKPLIEGTSIAKHFTKIFACDFIYDADGKPIAPGVAIDYTSKTQYIFRINKGCLEQYDNTMINEFVPMDERPIPLENIIYIGDGSTDIPAMKMVSHYDGLSLAVYKPGSSVRKQYAEKLLFEKRADVIAPANYLEGKMIHKIVKSRLSLIASRTRYEKLLEAR